MNNVMRKSNRDLIAPTRLLELAGDALPKSVSWDQVGQFGLTSFEAGMVEVLRGIAEEDFEYGVGNIPASRDMDQFGKLATHKASELSGKLDETAYNLFVEFDCTMQDASAAAAEEHFIQGFLRGYRYLKNQMEFGRGD